MNVDSKLIENNLLAVRAEVRQQADVGNCLDQAPALRGRRCFNLPTALPR